MRWVVLVGAALLVFIAVIVSIVRLAKDEPPVAEDASVAIEGEVPGPGAVPAEEAPREREDPSPPPRPRVTVEHVWETSLVLLGHLAPVRAVAFSQDGSCVVTGCDDWVTRVWDVETGRLLAELKAPRQAVDCVAASPDGALIAASSDENLFLWNLETGSLVQHTEVRAGRILRIGFFGDGLRVACNFAAWKACLCDPVSGQRTSVYEGYHGSVGCIDFSPDGSKIVAGGNDERALIWDVRTRECLAVLEGHSKHVDDVAFSADGKAVATASWDGTARMWDAETGKCLLVLDRHHGTVMAVDFSPDGDWLATACRGRMWVWDAGDGSSVALLKGHTRGVWSLAVSPDGQRIASGSWDKTARVWVRRPSTRPRRRQPEAPDEKEEVF